MPRPLTLAQGATQSFSAGAGAAPEAVQPQPVVLGQAMIPPSAAETGVALGSWPWLAAILAGFAAALLLAWMLRPRRAAAAPDEFFIPAPVPANDLGPARRSFRRSEPPPPSVTILAR